MKDVTAYTFEPAKVHCDVKVALKWSSLAITGKKGWRPLELKLYPDGHVSWKSKRTRHRAEYVIDAGYEGVGNNITLDLIIDNVQCRDGDVYTCTLLSEVVNQEAKSKVTTVGMLFTHIEIQTFKDQVWVSTQQCYIKCIRPCVRLGKIKFE